MYFDYTTETITPESTGMITFGGVQGVEIPTGTTAQRPVAGLIAGTLRFNTSLPSLETYNGTTWVSGSGVTSVALAAPSIFAVSGSPVTSTGTLILTLANQSANTVFAGPSPAGNPAAAPAFRTLGLAQGDLNDVQITSPTNGQVLSWNSTSNLWVNAGSSAGSYSTNISTWTLVSGSRYSALVTHSLATTNVVIQCYNAVTNALIQLDSIVITSANTITVYVDGGIPAYAVKIVIIANGMAILGPGSYIRTLSWFASSFDSPNSTDWVINSLAPAVADPTNAALTVRQFSNTVAQGIGCFVPVPSNATNIIFTYRGRAQSAPGSSGTLQLGLYTRTLANGSTTGTWSAVTNLPGVVVPASTAWQYYTLNVTLASLGLSAGSLYQFEITRNVGVVGNPAVNFLLVELDIAFT
jgi:hypothetical protein